MKSGSIVTCIIATVIWPIFSNAGVVYDDAAVSREFIQTQGFFCGNGSPRKSSLEWILETCCENDTNRFVQVAKETAATNSSFSATAIGIVRQYGSYGDIPFLRSFTNDVENAYIAALGVLKIEGVSTNSLEIVRDFLAVQKDNSTDQDVLAMNLMKQVFNRDYPQLIKDQTENVVLDYARRTTGVRMLDTVLMESDPTYSNSIRRLSVLRSASTLNLLAIQRAYTTNAINELVAYPESALPD